MDNALAVLTLPEACGSEEHCIGVCAEDAIHMAWLPWIGDNSRGKWQIRSQRPGDWAVTQVTESQGTTF